MILDAKKCSVIFRPPPHLPQHLKKRGFKYGGSWGVLIKNSLGDAVI